MILNTTQWKFWAVRRLLDPLLFHLFRSGCYEIKGLETFLTHCRHRRVILSVWHENLLLMPYFVRQFMPHQPISAVISKSRDGQLLESLIPNFPNVQMIRVAHNSRHTSMKAMLQALDETRVLFITPDGPQGPWKRIKPGVLQAALWSKSEVWALRWYHPEGSRRHGFHLPTPDRMKLPAPFQPIGLELHNCGLINDQNECKLFTQKLEKQLG